MEEREIGNPRINAQISEPQSYVVLFDDLTLAADAIEALRQMGLAEDQINVISGIPVTEHILGRRRQWSNVPRLALGGALAGLLGGLFLALGTPYLYPIHVGGQPLIAGAPVVVVVFEAMMLGMLVSTFLGVFLDSHFPSFGPKEYVPEISDGKIAVFFRSPQERLGVIAEALQKLGGAQVKLMDTQKI